MNLNQMRVMRPRLPCRKTNTKKQQIKFLITKEFKIQTIWTKYDIITK
jgi:hypothetical protein